MRFKIRRLCFGHSIGFEQLSDETGIIFLHSINKLIFVMETYCVS